MASMLNLTRTWNAVCSAASLRRGLALARDYARRRVAFGAPLSEKPLHLETLAGLAAEQEAALQLTFHAVALLGREEAGELDEPGQAVLRLLQPVAKLLDRAPGGGRRERGARGLRRRGLRRGHRPARDPARRAGALDLGGHDQRALARGLPRGRARRGARAVRGRDPRARGRGARRVARASRRGGRARQRSTPRRGGRAAAARGAAASEAGARRFAFTLGRALALALLVEQAQWDLDRDGDGRSAEAARRFARAGVDLLQDEAGDAAATARLALDEPGRG